ncbi:peptidoglycan-binding domain-containing protein [Microvirga guangxiensis]|uniref:Putative peptidoglycan binding domain-containing protein n=1 Tax=Microvirga guangxiensis TaxID=549386 RepID=A0A1G5GYS8_9HYPH|nr:peptidoglycan-binding domain-containing protein [Microvirga guangxiensis]SCY56753.1 Putative peptidoglycan binding domain-containing protein [Microvirga guangxiensis]
MKFNRMAVPVLALMSVTGWGAFGYSVLTSVEIEKQMRGQAAILQDVQAQYMEQQEKAEEAAKETAGLREQLAASQAELQNLSTRSKEIDAELANARGQLAASPLTGLVQGIGTSPDLLRIKPRPTKQDVIAAQEALTQLRFGDLKADGVIGSSTRKAVEEFQRTVGLPVTGELHAQTLLSLMRSAKVMAAQGERTEEPL